MSNKHIQSLDFKVDENGDFLIENGDFVIDDESQELLYSLIDSVTGDYKFEPQIGINLKQYINSPGNLAFFNLKNNIKTHMQNDGFYVNDLDINFNLSENKIKINTDYKRNRT